MRALAPLHLLAVWLLAGFAGCSQPSEPAVEIAHVHGLAFAEGRLHVATHHGLVAGEPDGGSWDWGYVGSERYDYMGFTRDAFEPRTFYSSGHPDDPHAFGGVHLGLRRSRDGGETWEQRSLQGQADFHALAALRSGAGHLAGVWQGALKVSSDGGATWTDHPAPGSVYALAASDGALWAATVEGLLRTADADPGNWSEVGGGFFPGAVASLAVSPDGTFLLASARDGVQWAAYRSTDGGATWSRLEPTALGEPSGPLALAIDPADPAHAFASTPGAAIFESRDQGAAWAVVRKAI